jgi:hypothetical protein
MITKKCPKCGDNIELKLKKCPKCGEEQKSIISKHPILTAILTFLILSSGSSYLKNNNLITSKVLTNPTAITSYLVKSEEPKDITVYVTRTVHKYHRSGCQYLRQSQIEISLSAAKQSYGPCSRCNPPR